jgi:hypothetical protein
VSNQSKSPIALQSSSVKSNDSLNTVPTDSTIPFKKPLDSLEVNKKSASALPHQLISHHKMHLVKEIAQLQNIFYQPHRAYGNEIFIPGLLSSSPAIQIRNSISPNLGNLPQRWNGQLSAGKWSFHPTEINVDGSSGIIKSSPLQTHLDTPQVYFQWERYAFGGNYFQLDFRRKLTNNFAIGMDLETRSTDSSGIWEYQNTVHQPFTGGLKRDSVHIPYTGRNLKEDQLLLSPWMNINSPLGSFLYSGKFFWDNDEDAHPDKIKYDANPTLPISFESNPFKHNHSQKGHSLTHIGNLFSLKSRTFWKYQNTKTEYQSIDLLPTFRNLTKDTINTFGASHESNWQGIHLYNKIFQLKLEQHTQGLYNFYSYPKNKSRQEQFNQLLSLSYQSPYFTKIQIGGQYLSDPKSERYYPQASLYTKWNYKWFSINSHARYYARQSSLENKYLFDVSRYKLPNPNLQVEKIKNLGFETKVGSNVIYLIAGGRQEIIDDWIGPGYLDVMNSGINQISITNTSTLTASDSINLYHTYGLKNYNQSLSHAIHYGFGFHLGNWEGENIRYHILSQKYHNGSKSLNIPHKAKVFYQGYLKWSRTVLNSKKLGLSSRFSWQWHGSKKVVAFDRKEKMIEFLNRKNFLILDYELRMKVLDFELFYRILNLNHTRYATEAGYTPYGMNFHWGVSWKFSN